MLRVVFEPTTPVFERAKTAHALDRAATVIGEITTLLSLKRNIEMGDKTKLQFRKKKCTEVKKPAIQNMSAKQ
jgi:hypothetical protein